MQDRNRFQILRRNPDGTLRVEYLKTAYANIDVPKEEDGNELRGHELLTELNNIVQSMDDVDLDENIDSSILDELQIVKTKNPNDVVSVNSESVEGQVRIGANTSVENPIFPTPASGFIPSVTF